MMQVNGHRYLTLTWQPPRNAYLQRNRLAVLCSGQSRGPSCEWQMKYVRGCTEYSWPEANVMRMITLTTFHG